MLGDREEVRSRWDCEAKTWDDRRPLSTDPGSSPSLRVGLSGSRSRRPWSSQSVSRGQSDVASRLSGGSRAGGRRGSGSRVGGVGAALRQRASGFCSPVASLGSLVLPQWLIVESYSHSLIHSLTGRPPLPRVGSCTTRLHGTAMHGPELGTGQVHLRGACASIRCACPAHACAPTRTRARPPVHYACLATVHGGQPEEHEP